MLAAFSPISMSLCRNGIAESNLEISERDIFGILLIAVTPAKPNSTGCALYLSPYSWLFRRNAIPFDSLPVNPAESLQILKITK